MLPYYYLSPESKFAPFQYGDSLTSRNLVDYEMGGVDLNDSSQGLIHTLWKIEVVGSDVIVSKNGIDPTTLFSASGITEISFTFDQNMNPFVAFVQNTQSKYYWFDPDLASFTTVLLDSYVRNPRVCMDDKRSDMTVLGRNDIVLAYLNNRDLCYRLQRERFETERVLRVNAGSRLLRIGMNTDNKLQFMLRR